MSDPFGFGTNLLGVTSRPSGEPRVFTSSDTFAVDCSSAAADDGTDISAEWANELVGNLRSFLRANGNKLDGVTKIISEDHSDAMILNAALHLIQRGRTNYAVDTGTQNALAVTLNPAPAELLDGMRITVKPLFDSTGACTLVVNGGTALNIVDFNGATPTPRALRAGRPRQLEYISGTWQLVANYAQSLVPVGATATIWVRTDGNDNNDGSANDSSHAVQTLTAGLSQAALRAVGGTINVRLGVGGTYPAPAAGAVPSILGTLNIIGDTSGTAQDSYIIQGAGAANGGSLIIAGLKASISGVKIDNNSSTGACHTLVAQNNSSVSLDHVTLNYSGVGGDTLSHLFYGGNSQVSLGAGCKIAGSKGFMFWGQTNGSLYMGPTCNLVVSGGPTFTTTLLLILQSSVYVESGASISGSATGKRYDLRTLSGVVANGAGASFFPGTVSGTADTSSSYAP